MTEKLQPLTPTRRIVVRLNPAFGEGSPATSLYLGIQPIKTLKDLLENDGGDWGGWIVILTPENRMEIEAEIARKEERDKNKNHE